MRTLSRNQKIVASFLHFVGTQVIVGAAGVWFFWHVSLMGFFLACGIVTMQHGEVAYLPPHEFGMICGYVVGVVFASMVLVLVLAIVYNVGEAIRWASRLKADLRLHVGFM